MSDTPQEGRRLKREGARAKRASQGRVFTYMTILFAAAFLLLLMAFLMQQRANRETIDDLTESMTSIHSLQDLVDANASLQQQVADLEKQVEDLETKYQEEVRKSQESIYTNISLKEEWDRAKKSLEAMDWFWQVDEAYALGRYTKCRELMASMEEQGLPKYLPTQSVTDNGRFSPAARYAEISDKLN